MKAHFNPNRAQEKRIFASNYDAARPSRVGVQVLRSVLLSSVISAPWLPAGMTMVDQFGGQRADVRAQNMRPVADIPFGAMNYGNVILLILLQAAHVVMGLVLPVFLVRWLRKPQGWWSRAGVATVVCWVGLVLLATLQHYSVGNAELVMGSGNNHEAVAERGWSVESNQILFMLVTGWAMPAMMLLAVALHRWLMHDDATS